MPRIAWYNNYTIIRSINLRSTCYRYQSSAGYHFYVFGVGDVPVGGGGVVGARGNRYGGVVVGVRGMLWEGEGGGVGRGPGEGGEVGCFCEGHGCLLSRRLVVEDEAIGFGLHGEAEMRRSHGDNGSLCI